MKRPRLVSGYTAVAAAGLILSALIACSPDATAEAPAPPTTPIVDVGGADYDAYAWSTLVPTIDGRQVQCVIVVGLEKGGPSCDWETYAAETAAAKKGAR